MRRVVLFIILLSLFKMSADDKIIKECEGYTFSVRYVTMGLDECLCADILSVSYEALEPSRESGHLIIPDYFIVDGVEYPVCYISEKVFQDMDLENIVELTFPKHCRRIENSNFLKMRKLRKVNFGSELDGIYGHNFNDMPDLEEFELPPLFVGIGEDCLNYVGIRKFSLPWRVTRVGWIYHTLSNLPNLVELDLGSVIFLDSGAFCNIPLLEKIEIPGICKSIDLFVFNNLESLKSVTFAKRDPDAEDLTVSGNAFADCPLLKDVYVKDTEPFKAGYRREGIYNICHLFKCTLHVPSGSKDAYSSAPFWCEFSNIVEEGASVDELAIDDDGLSSQAAVWYSVDGRVVDPASYRGIAIKKCGSAVTKHFLK